MEKEARTWPILLTTPLTDAEIIRGKAIAAFRRNMPLILIYFALICFRYVLYSNQFRSQIMPQLLYMLVLSVCSIVATVFFVIGSGLYFGVRLRTTTAAFAATAGLYFVVTYLLCGVFNPVRFLMYRQMSRQDLRWLAYAIPITVSLMKGGIGGVFAWRAVRRVRCNLF
jgi:ABC-type transport system involved in multi-copper enzyme maturation permease subunit